MGFSPFHFRDFQASRCPCFEVLDWMMVDEGWATDTDMHEMILN